MYFVLYLHYSKNNRTIIRKRRSIYSRDNAKTPYLYWKYVRCRYFWKKLSEKLWIIDVILHYDYLSSNFICYVSTDYHNPRLDAIKLLLKRIVLFFNFIFQIHSKSNFSCFVWRHIYFFQVDTSTPDFGNHSVEMRPTLPTARSFRENR